MADGTFALYEAIRQEAVLRFAIQLALNLLVEQLTVQEPTENVLSYPVVVLGISMREQVIADAERLLSFQKALMILLEKLPCRDAARIGLHRNRRTVSVRAANHQHMVALEPMIARKYVGR